MSYTIYCDDYPLYKGVDDLTLLEPELVLEDSCAGSLSFKALHSHPYRDKIKTFTSDIIVRDDGEEIFRGRVINEYEDFFKTRSYEVEGELGFLNDSIQPPKEFHNYSVESFLKYLLDVHNAHVGENRRFKLGRVTVRDSNDSIYRYTNWDNTLKCINEKLLKVFGGHLLIRHEKGSRYLDYLAEYPRRSTQTIRLGANLVDFSKGFDLTDLTTVVIPLGARLENSPIPALEAYTTIESVNGGKNFIENAEAIKNFGRIEKTVTWDDVTKPENLLRKARKYLTDKQFCDMSLEIKAVDLHNLDRSIEPFKLLDEVQVISRVHGLDRLFPITKMEIPIDQPGKLTYTLGTTVKRSLTARNSDDKAVLKSVIDQLPSRSALLSQAKESASELLKAGTEGGNVVLSTKEILIMDNPDKNKARKIWRFNSAGFGYTKNGYDGLYGTAITMDGRIVADYITTGTMQADRIKGGTLKLGGTDNGNGSMFMYNSDGKIIGGWDKDGIKASEGDIAGWQIASNGLISKKGNEQFGLMSAWGDSLDDDKNMIYSMNLNPLKSYWSITRKGRATGLKLSENTSVITTNGTISLKDYIKGVIAGTY